MTENSCFVFAVQWTQMEAKMQGEYIITHKIWNGVKIEIVFQQNYLQYDDGQMMSQVEIISEKRVSLPFAPNGYKSCLMEAREIEKYNDLWDFVINWLGTDIFGRNVRPASQNSQQISLF